MDLYERIMNMQLFNNYMQWIQKYFKRELISDRFKSISIIMVKPKFCCTLVFWFLFKFNKYFFILKITNILHCIKIESKIKSIKPRRINTIGLLILSVCISITLHPHHLSLPIPSFAVKAAVINYPCDRWLLRHCIFPYVCSHSKVLNLILLKVYLL